MRKACTTVEVYYQRKARETSILKKLRKYRHDIMESRYNQRCGTKEGEKAGFTLTLLREKDGRRFQA